MSTSTVVKALPTTDQLKAYADQLPEIYREVLSVFATADPYRRYHGDLSLETILAHVLNRGQKSDGSSLYDSEELLLALVRLKNKDLLVRDDVEPYYHPTSTGEELIAILTGRHARKVSIPELPQPNW